jgi:NAD(P)-dependent dehydrogenase (short-subunit alcohol dehydrogenase family)
MGKLDGQVALVTGGNKGIGKGIALGLAGEGAALVLVARGKDDLDRAAAEVKAMGNKVLALTADVTDERQVEDIFRRTVDQFGRLDILVNNAGAFDGGPLDELTTEAWDKVIAVNLRAPFLCTRAAAFRPLQREQAWTLGSDPGHRAGRPAVWHLLRLSPSGQCAC